MMRQAFFSICKTMGLFHLARWVTRRKLRILGYHGVWFSDQHFGNHLFVSAEKFKDRMAWLSSSPYRVISLSSALNDLKKGCIRPNTTVITIDDGWYGTYLHMLPALQECNFPATLYVYTAAVESRKPNFEILVPALIALSESESVRLYDPLVSGYMSVLLSDKGGVDSFVHRVLEVIGELGDDEIDLFVSELLDQLGFDYAEVLAGRQFDFMTYDEVHDAGRRGLDIQLHTHTHSLDVEHPEGIEKEIKLNRSRLEPHVQSGLEHFCYPSGTYSPAMYDYLERCGVVSATLVEAGLVDEKSNRYALKRILDGQNVSQLEFEAEMSGLLTLVRQARGLFRSDDVQAN